MERNLLIMVGVAGVIILALFQSSLFHPSPDKTAMAAEVQSSVPAEVGTTTTIQTSAKEVTKTVDNPEPQKKIDELTAENQGLKSELQSSGSTGNEYYKNYLDLEDKFSALQKKYDSLLSQYTSDVNKYNDSEKAWEISCTNLIQKAYDAGKVNGTPTYIPPSYSLRPLPASHCSSIEITPGTVDTNCY